MDDAFLEAAGPQLKVVANVAVGFDNIDVPAATKRGVVVTNTPRVLTEATADLAMSLILMATRRLAEGERWIREQRPWAWHMFMLLGTGLQGKTLGVVGMGQIGGALARRAKAFGMTIVYSDERQAPPELEAELEAERLELDDLLARSHVVSVHAPLMDSTRHLFNAERLAQDALRRVPGQQRPRAADRRGRARGGAAERRHRRRRPRRLRERATGRPAACSSSTTSCCCPISGSATIETRTAMAELAARNALAVLAGERPETALNYDDVSR